MYDEPTAGLDPVASTVVEDLIRSLHVTDEAAGGNGAGPRAGIASYIVVTHQHSTIRRAVDRLIFLHEVRRARTCMHALGGGGVQAGHLLQEAAPSPPARGEARWRAHALGGGV